MREAADIIDQLQLEAHPEGGHYRQTFRDQDGGERGHSTAIYYLLQAGEISAWHRVLDAAEIWHHYAGAALMLNTFDEDEVRRTFHLGSDLAAGQRPQFVVPALCWQSARSMGEWSLCGCTVAPGFEFSRFQMAPADWRPGGTVSTPGPPRR